MSAATDDDVPLLDGAALAAAEAGEPPGDGDGAPEGPLLLIDGNSLAYRAFFALPDTIATADGFPTNALYGLAAMMMKVLADERPGRAVVAWDPPGPVFRHERYPEYKAGRSATPDLLREQKPHFRPLMEAFGFVNVDLEGYEADDVLGTLAVRAADAGRQVVILTGDRDALQLVDDRISVLATGRGVTDTVRYTPERVVERYGLPPEQMPDFRGLVGDSSDNLPGVRGIGEKGAAQLIQKYGSLDEVLAHAEEQTPKRREALITGADDARTTRDLARIVRDAPVDLDPEEVPPLVMDPDRLALLRDLFTRWEFTSLVRRLSELSRDGSGPDAAVAAVTRTVEVEEVAPEAVAMRLAGAAEAGLVARDGRFAVAPPEGGVLTGELAGGEGALVAALAGLRVAAHDAKALPYALQDAGLRVAHDTMVAAYLLEPRRRGYPLAEVAHDAGLGVEGTEDELAREAALVADLAARQGPRLADGGLEDLYRDIEMPLVDVLAAMERAGVRLDTARLAEIAARVRDRAEELRDQIWEMAGEEFVIDSPKQLGRILFEVLGLPTFRKGKTGWSTDRQVLKLLEPKHPVIGLIGQYRELTKLDNTYLSALPDLVGADGRLHTTFNQTVAETGRLSSTHPNLQNIPIRTAVGREIRDAFVAEEGHRIISCDYSQVELRLMAHASGEPTLREAFLRGEDVHRATAAEVFGMAPGDVDRVTRDRAKAVNFGIMYGISDFGLSEQLGIPRADAKAYIETYLARYPRVRAFIDRTVAGAAQDGYVTTLLGRRRPIPELTGRTLQQRQLGERLAVNTVIQGTAADIIKLAMVRAHAALGAAGLRTRLILQIHDELLFEAPEDEVEAAITHARAAMVNAFTLDPPLAVDVGVGTTWRDAKA
ncbi:MAG TPA: DNA polymerase I [Miltoncostaeaceae bacterium]|nr:DNA polymerase I [Miltoncostaeaceae bacterium]